VILAWLFLWQGAGFLRLLNELEMILSEVI